MRILFLVCALLSPLPTSSLAWGAVRPVQARAAGEFRSTSAGFAITKPGEDWSEKTEPGPFGIRSLSMSPPESGGKVAFSIQILPTSSLGPGSAADQRDTVLQQIQGLPSFRDVEAIDLELLGKTVPGLLLDQESAGLVYRVKQAYLVENGILYKFQFHAPKSDFRKLEQDFERSLSSFRTVPFDEASKRSIRLTDLAKRCGSEVQQHTDWEQAAQQAEAQGKQIVVTVQAVSGFDVNDGIARGPLMDRDVVALLQSRFVVLRWKKGMGAPFEDQALFGLGPSTFGSGMLVVRPDGSVLKQVFVLDGTAVYDVLLVALEDSAGVSIPRPRAGAARAEQIQFLLGSGQLEAAAELLAHPTKEDAGALDAYLRADLLRLRRDGPRAIEAILQALELLDADEDKDQELRARCELLHTKLLTSTGRAVAAEALLDGLLGGQASEALRAEQLFLKGALRLQAKDRKAAELAWQPLIEEHPESPWAWLVSAAIGGALWEIDLYPNLEWASPDHRRLIELPEPMELGKGAQTIDSMVQGALNYLIAAQQADGSWLVASAYGDTDPLGDDFDLAATAIGGRALLRIPKNTEARSAATRALEWLHRRRQLLEQREAPPVVFMDYAVWSRSYGVFFLADCLDAGLGEQSAVRELLALYLVDLVDRQQPNGGWSYYLSGKAGEGATPQSISFTTATVVMALERAQGLGFDLPKRTLKRGLDCLEAMRSPHGTFGYFLNGRSVKTGQRTSDGVEASAARGPVCSLALIRGERESGRDLDERLELYIEHLDAFGAQRRKALMHAGEHTQGSHYLLYDYSTAAEALVEPRAKSASKKLVRKTREAILAQLRACQNRDGSFVDNPLIGADAGTGLALSCLLDLAR